MHAAECVLEVLVGEPLAEGVVEQVADGATVLRCQRGGVHHPYVGHICHCREALGNAMPPGGRSA